MLLKNHVSKFKKNVWHVNLSFSILAEDMTIQAAFPINDKKKLLGEVFKLVTLEPNSSDYINNDLKKCKKRMQKTVSQKIISKLYQVNKENRNCIPWGFNSYFWICC